MSHPHTIRFDESEVLGKMRFPYAHFLYSRGVEKIEKSGIIKKIIECKKDEAVDDDGGVRNVFFGIYSLFFKVDARIPSIFYFIFHSPLMYFSFIDGGERE